MQAAMQREGCLKRRNKSIPLTRLFFPLLSVTANLLICPWVYSSNRGARMPSVWPCTCTLQPKPRLVWQLGLDWLPARAGLKSWSVMRRWFQMPTAAHVWQSDINPPDWKLYFFFLFIFFFFFYSANSCMHTHRYVTLGAAYVAWL